MEDLSLHILDIVENAIRAKAKKVIIEILEDESKGLLTLRISDNGEGMSHETVNKSLDPFFTTKDRKKVGLGLSLLSQAAQQTGGELRIDSEKGRGTKVTAVFKLTHLDMKPVGDVLKTIATLITGNPEIRFIYSYKKGNYNYHFDSYKY